MSNRLRPSPRVIRLPSGLEMEVMPPRSRTLWPLLVTNALLWSAAGAAAWFLWTVVTAS